MDEARDVINGMLEQGLEAAKSEKLDDVVQSFLRKDDEGEIKKMWKPEMSNAEWIDVVKQEFEKREIYDPDGYIFTEVLLAHCLDDVKRELVEKGLLR